MRVFISILCIISASYAIVCSVAGDGFYCNADKSYTWCAGGGSYHMNCAPGTGCNCGTDVSCPTPCTTGCEMGTATNATTFCASRMTSFPSTAQTGYFCNGNGGFYQCVRDANCPTLPSFVSGYSPCDSGTVCSCTNSYQECSSGLFATPCGSSTPDVGNSECAGHRFNCYTITSEDPVFCGESLICNLDPTDDLNVCFWNADSNDGICAEDFNCFAPQCNFNADCESGYVCIINSCCGPQGVCAAACN